MKNLNDFMSAFSPTHASCVGISAGDALKACEMGAVMLDIREEDFTLYKQFKVPKVFYMPLSKANAHIDKLPDNLWLIVADAAGNLSREFARKLLEAGYSKVCVLSGGVVDWERAGFPISTHVSHEMSGSCVCQLKKRNLR
jgi:rhodanese-related sulfurtransferase